MNSKFQKCFDECTSDIKKYLYKDEINEINFEKFIKNIENQKISRYYRI